MAVAEHTYSYLEPSTVATEDGRSELTLATSGGREANPYFFTGFLGRPQQTASALLVVARSHGRATTSRRRWFARASSPPTPS